MTFQYPVPATCPLRGLLFPVAQVRLDMASSHEYPPEQAQSHNEEKLMDKHSLSHGCRLCPELLRTAPTLVAPVTTDLLTHPHWLPILLWFRFLGTLLSYTAFDSMPWSLLEAP